MPFFRLAYVLLILLVVRAADAMPQAELRPQIADALNSLYAASSGTKLWVRSGQPKQVARAALRILADSRSHGLDDRLYGVDTLYLLHAKLLQGRDEYAEDFELGLSIGLLRLIGDLRPAEFDGQHSEDRATDLSAAIRDAVRANRLEQLFEDIVPRNPQYRALREALQLYQRRAGAAPAIIIGDGPALKRGDVAPRVARLRERLLGSGNVAENDIENASLFDDVLERAVRDYQAAHGLAADGIAGAGTIRHLNMSDEERIARIKLNLERWRRLPLDLGHDHILVNIPEFRLRYVRGREESLSMRVVVGSEKNPTPEFYDEIEYLVFNPYWYVPNSILRKEILPTVRKNADYLSSNRYELLADGRAIAPEEVDLESIDFSRFPYRVRQKPGARNALGAVKFLFPNSKNIYLHDSPAKGLFAKSKRAFSHGCIRLEKPDLLARALLQKNAEWTESRINQKMGRGARYQVNLDETVPIYLAYFTVRVLDNGDVAFFNDIYERDSANLAKYL